MHGDDLPNILSTVTVALTLLVIWYARGTIIEARKATEEEQKTVLALQDVIATTRELAASSASTLAEARRTAELASEAREREHYRSQVEHLRTILAFIAQVDYQAGQPKDGGALTWVSPQQAAIGQALGISGLDLPECAALAQTAGPDAIRIAALRARAEVLEALRGLGATAG